MLLDADALKKSSELDPTIAEFIKANPSMPALDWQDAATAKLQVGMLEQMTLKALGPAEAALSESYMDITMRDGFQNKVTVVKPASPPAGGSPLVVLIFGGGWICGSCDQMTIYARALARLYGAVVVNLGYRLAPEHKWPTQQNDCFDSTKWLAANASTLGADPTKGFVVGGGSAGGNCAAVVAQLAQEEKLAHPITGQWLSIPSIMDTHAVPEKFKPYFQARVQNANAPVLHEAAMKALKEHCQWDENSPLRYPSLYKGSLSALPPAFFQICGMDPLRDDGLIYDEMLKDAGVKTRVDFYPGCPHAHWQIYPGLEISMRAVGDMLMGMGWLLGGNIPERQEVLQALPAPVPANI